MSGKKVEEVFQEDLRGYGRQFGSLLAG